jgi:hypothetical protein
MKVIMKPLQIKFLDSSERDKHQVMGEDKHQVLFTTMSHQVAQTHITEGEAVKVQYPVGRHRQQT